MKIKESFRYLMTDIILDMLAIAYLIFLGYHFYVVLDSGSITVHEPIHWILNVEIYMLVPLLNLFGLWKLLEDIILYRKSQIGFWHTVTEISLGMVYLGTTSFITYHFWGIWTEGSSKITSAHPVLIMWAIGVSVLLAVFKTIEDFGDIKKVKEKNK